MQYALLFFFLLLRNIAITVKTSATAKATAMMTIIASAALTPGLTEPPPVFWPAAENRTKVISAKNPDGAELESGIRKA